MRNVQRLLKSCPTIKYEKIKRKPPLTELRKKVRLDFGRKCMLWTKKWKIINFSDKKESLNWMDQIAGIITL